MRIPLEGYNKRGSPASMPCSSSAEVARSRSRIDVSKMPAIGIPSLLQGLHELPPLVTLQFIPEAMRLALPHRASIGAQGPEAS